MRVREMQKNLTTQLSAGLIDLDTIREQSRREEAEKRRQTMLDDQLGKIPPRYQGKTFDDFFTPTPSAQQVKRIVQQAVKVIESIPLCLFFLGKPSTGKTMLAFIVYRTMAEAGLRVHYESSLLFLKTLQEKRFESSATFQSQLSYYRDVDFLILDEFSESISRDGAPVEFEKRLMFEVIDARYQQQRPTLVISNRNYDQLVARLGLATVERLSEKSATLMFDWPSWRTGRTI